MDAVTGISIFQLYDFQILEYSWASDRQENGLKPVATLQPLHLPLFYVETTRWHKDINDINHLATPARDGSDQTGIAERCQGEIGKNHLGPLDANIKIEFLKYATQQHIWANYNISRVVRSNFVISNLK